MSALQDKSAAHGFYNLKPFFRRVIIQLKVEIASMNISYRNLYNTFATIKLLQDREKRSLLPFTWSALSFLFGTMSDADLGSIRRNIGLLNKNQKRIAHVVKESLTVIKTTRTAVSENRVVINKILDQLKYFNAKSKQVNDGAMQETMNISILLQLYIKLERLIAELTDFMQEAVTYMDMLQMLSSGHLSPSTIPPNEFRKLLVEIQSHFPFYQELPSDPEKNLWDFYN